MTLHEEDKQLSEAKTNNKINRRDWVSNHNPILEAIDYTSPLTVGNGELAYTFDVTGMQSLYQEYSEKGFPLCTMSQWGWHTTPVKEGERHYELSDLVHTEYNHNGRLVSYASHKNKENEEIYDWLRENPHRINLAKIGLQWRDEPIGEGMLSGCHQELNLYEGIATSQFTLHNCSCHIKTSVHGTKDIIGFELASDLLLTGDLSIDIGFSYGSSLISGADWNNESAHSTSVYKADEHEIHLVRILDDTCYHVEIASEHQLGFSLDNHHLKLSFNKNKVDFTIAFSQDEAGMSRVISSNEVFENAKKTFQRYWELGGAISFTGSKDPRAKELERRIVLSKYLLKIQSGASMPSQETGLTCNSWYGKFHLEMHIWHAGFLPLWQHSEDLEKSLSWYQDILGHAQANAKKNQYIGARWPKMVAYQGIDCPSWIATLLIWQQPHLIYLLEMMYKATFDENEKQRLLNTYWPLIKETAEFMCDFAVLNKELKVYELKAPIIPVQEVFAPEETNNPFFEVAYWKFTLEIAVSWANRRGETYGNWEGIASQMVDLPEMEGYYIPRENEKEAFTKYQTDHPSVLMAYGFINGKGIQPETMKTTLEKILDCWELDTLWGWDFPVMAMTATRLGSPQLAVDLLMMDSPKNTYVISGNNFQRPRKDLPVYLPGNGALLLAVAMMSAGYGGNEEQLPGFPKDDQWQVAYEGIWPLPY